MKARRPTVKKDFYKAHKGWPRGDATRRVCHPRPSSRATTRQPEGEPRDARTDLVEGCLGLAEVALRQINRMRLRPGGGVRAVAGERRGVVAVRRPSRRRESDPRTRAHPQGLRIGQGGSLTAWSTPRRVGRALAVSTSRALGPPIGWVPLSSITVSARCLPIVLQSENRHRGRGLPSRR